MSSWECTMTFFLSVGDSTVDDVGQNRREGPVGDSFQDFWSESTPPQTQHHQRVWLHF